MKFFKMCYSQQTIAFAALSQIKTNIREFFEGLRTW